MRSLVSQNDNYNYILTVINVLSKYAWGILIKRKTGAYLTVTFKKILEIENLNYFKPIKEKNYITNLNTNKQHRLARY